MTNFQNVQVCDDKIKSIWTSGRIKDSSDLVELYFFKIMLGPFILLTFLQLVLLS